MDILGDLLKVFVGKRNEFLIKYICIFAWLELLVYIFGVGNPDIPTENSLVPCRGKFLQVSTIPVKILPVQYRDKMTSFESGIG